jgi:hypothetical protein
MWKVVIIHQDGTSEAKDYDTKEEANAYFKEKLGPGSTDSGYIYEEKE